MEPDLDGSTQRLRLEARRNAYLQAELDAHRSRVRLRESYNAFPFSGGFGELVSPFQQYFDGGAPIYTAFLQRRVGSNSIGIQPAQLDYIRLYARFLYDTHPVGQGVIRGKRNYIFGGTGFTYSVQAKPGENLSEALQEQCQRLLEDFLECNRWHLREPERYTRAMRDGESILRITPSDDEECCAYLRTIEPEQVRPPNPAPEWYAGVHTAEGDREKTIGYGVTMAGDLSDWEEVPEAEVSFLKIGTDLAVPRGLSCFFTSQQLITGAQKLLEAGVEGEQVRQAIAYIRQHALADKTAVDTLANMNTDFDTKVHTQGGPRSVPTERVVPGSVHDMPESMQVAPPPIGDASNATTLLAGAYQALSVYFQVPQWMVSGDTGNTNFAASLTAESPLVKDVESEQQFYSKENISLFKKVLTIAETQGRLPEGTVKKIAIYAECPSPAVRDAQKETDQNKVLSDAGLLSDETWSEREGLDYEAEQARGATKAVDPALGGAPESTDPKAVYKQETEK